MSTRTGNQPTDDVRGYGPYTNRVEFTDLAVKKVIDSRTVHPVDAVEWGDEAQDMDGETRDKVRGAVLYFLNHWLGISDHQRKAIAHRATGSTLAEVGRALGGKSAQYAEKTIRQATVKWPGLAFAFEDMRHKTNNGG